MAYVPSTSDEDLLVQATGAPVLQSKQVEHLMLKARKSKFNRINVFFNSREGWLLRRIVRHHYSRRTKSTRCILCAGNVKGALRPLTNTSCSVCSVALCRSPREEENGLSCWDLWHNTDILVKRVYYSQPTLDKMEGSTGDTLPRTVDFQK